MRSKKSVVRAVVIVTAVAALSWSGTIVSGQSKANTGSDRRTTITDSNGRKHTKIRPITIAEKMAAAERLKAKRQASIAQAQAAYDAAIAAGAPTATAMAALAAAISGQPPLLVGANGQLIPDYSGVTPNWALSPAPAALMVQPIDPVTGLPMVDANGLPVFVPDIDPATLLPKVDPAGPVGLQKFVDTLPGLTAAGANDLGQYLPIAIPDTTSFPGTDYYEIELGDYFQKLHRDLPPTKLRGYRQTNTSDATVSVFSYLGPVIIAQRGHPVRIKFTNKLPTGAGGNLFLPVDATIMGAGQGPGGPAGTGDVACAHAPNAPVPAGCYTENRATLHLHGGVTPWISDGTPYQWITPASETTPYPEGVSVYNVPDMPNPGKPGTGTPNPAGSGSQTFYYTNDQSARLMFYHDHASGITRLNVYAGEAAGYLVQDPVETDLVARGVIPADQIPLIIQDKTFVDASTVRLTDPTWNWGSGTTYTPYTDPNGKTLQMLDPVTGDLWLPHVYMPAQNPFDITGVNPMGRWPYGPWFWPPAVVPFGPMANPYYDCDAMGQPIPPATSCRTWQAPEVPSTPNPSWGAEAFMDTPLVNGTVYPTLNVDAKPYRFRILDAANDRFFNLQLYVAVDNKTASTAEATAAGLPFTPCIGGKVDGCTEVRMVPASPATPGLPSNWPTDGRVGGVPDPALAGPDFIQIGTEGGFLPMPVVIPQQPIAWNLDPTTFNFGNVSDHALLLGPAERVDVIVDFSQYAGKTLILYNDAPAPFPAYMPSNDYFTGGPDMRDAGGAFTTLPGYGPNIRTIMQIKVSTTGGTPIDPVALAAAWGPQASTDPLGNPITLPGVFQRDQDPIVVGQSGYDAAYGTTFPANYPVWGVARIQDSSLTFQSPAAPVGQGFVTLDFQPKAIHDEMGATFDDYGRSSAKLGLELPKPGPLNAQFVMQGYSDPATELVMLSKIGQPIGGPLGDGTQIWKITHNGVDTHPVHFHLFHVQLINRVGWDGAIRLPDANELGWKDTLRISPLEDTIVALRPLSPDPAKLPWKIPNSIRPLNPAIPLGSSVGFSGLDPLGNNVTVFNDNANFGWEYVWHCHILSHEENDMMRAVSFAVPPGAPTLLSVIVSGSNNNRRATLTWSEPDAGVQNKTGYTVQRANDPGFTSGLVSTPVGLTTSFIDPIGRSTTPYFYRVAATNTIGSTVTGFPTMTATSDFSNVISINPLLAPGPLVATLQSSGRVLLTFTDNAVNETGFVVERSTGVAGNFVAIATLPARTNTGNVTYTDTTAVAGVTNQYQVKAIAGVLSSAYSNVASVTLPALPAAPTGLVATAVAVSNNNASVTLTWVDNATNEANYIVQRSTDPNFAVNVTTSTLPANVTTFTQTGLARATTFYFRVQATNLGGASAFATVSVVTP